MVEQASGTIKIRSKRKIEETKDENNYATSYIILSEKEIEIYLMEEKKNEKNEKNEKSE